MQPFFEAPRLARREAVFWGVEKAARRDTQAEAAEREEKEADRESAKAKMIAAHAAARAARLARGGTGAAPNRRSEADR